jgi:hypothetical protein
MDIFLAILVWLFTAGTAYLGVYVTLHPPEDEKQKTRFKRLFVGLTVFAAIVVGYQTYLGRRAQRQLDAIQHNTEQPPQVTVNVPTAKQHARVDWIGPVVPRDDNGRLGYKLTPFHASEVPILDLGYSDGGEISLRDAQMRAMIIVTATGSDDSVFVKNREALVLTHPATGGDLNSHSSALRYRTFVGKALDKDEAKQLNKGTKSLCVIATASWTDDNGRYETDFSRCLSRESFAPPNTFNWHINPEDERQQALP